MTSKYYIYSISHSTDNSLGRYIGSTANYNQRKAIHRYDCKRGIPSKLYTVIRENGGMCSWVFKILETVYSDNPEDRRKAEQRWIDIQTCLLNTNKAYCPYKQYYEEHQDEIKDYKRVYYVKNREEIKKRKKEQQKEKRLKQLQDIAAQGLQPKRRSKNDPLENQPPEVQEKITIYNIQNDCECSEVQC